MARISDSLRAVGAQVRQLRIAADLSQAELADRANLGVATVRRLEAGQDVSLSTLIATLRVLGRTDWLDGLDPIGSGPTPMELLRARRAEPARPQRVSRRRATAATQTQPSPADIGHRAPESREQRP